jgi:uncharacterized protein (TIGR02246 family)
VAISGSSDGRGCSAARGGKPRGPAGMPTMAVAFAMAGLGSAVWSLFCPADSLAVAAETAPAASAPAAAEPAAAVPLDPAFVAAIESAHEAVVETFNAHDPAGIAGLFTPSGELIDENGGVHAGRDAIRDAFATFFEAFPNARLLMEVEDVRRIDDDLAIEEGVRLVLVDEGETAAQVRFVAVRTKEGDTWPIASYREFADDPPPTAREMVEQLEWMVGEWIDESPEGRTQISYRWSDDGNYLLGEFNLAVGGLQTGRSTQRIGWDPVDLTIRSWTFDSDGGFSEGIWTPDDEGWVVRSFATLPDGSTGTATLTFAMPDDDHVMISGEDRFVAGEPEPDFSLTIARRQPRPGQSQPEQQSGTVPAAGKAAGSDAEAAR